MITFFSASAGSGKTHCITGQIIDQLAAGSCRPGGLIATTFTQRAAAELANRLRLRLHEQGRAPLADALDEAMIGTVHSVCGQLLRRFAFEAGVSPRVEVIAPPEARILFSRAVEEVADSATLERLERWSRSLGQRDARTGTALWKSQVHRLVEACRTNDFTAGQLPGFAAVSVAEVVAGLLPVWGDDPTAALRSAVDEALKALATNGDDTKGTQTYADQLNGAWRRLEAGQLPWSDWVKLTKAEPSKPSMAVAAKVQAAAAGYERHPGLRQELSDYTHAVFALAALALDRFQALKAERGLLDYADLEQQALHLLRDQPAVRDLLRQELDLLVVDEFQDTSPIQLALFLELARCARETIWVGDVKQAIYGFRASDPELVGAVLRELPARGGRMAASLATSWRSTPALVHLASELFVPAFQSSLGLPETEVRLTPNPERTPAPEPAVEWARLSSGQFNKTRPGRLKKLTKPQFAEVLAEIVRQQLAGNPVVDRTSHQLRPVTPRDVAVLCRTNDAATDVAEALRSLGVPVALAAPGLLATPEACLGLACLRRLADPKDSLAAAEIVALTGGGDIGPWLENRLAYVAGPLATEGAQDRWGLEAPFVHPVLLALEARRASLKVWSPAEALSAALEAADAFRAVSAWGPDAGRAEQRRANLEALRALVGAYEEAAASQQVPATIAGFFFWTEERKRIEEDAVATDEAADAVHVDTYHSAKGLEWPVVLLTDLDETSEPRLWDITTARREPTTTVQLDSLLADRQIRFWIWPFGQQKTGIPLADRLEAGPVGRAAAHLAHQEDLRLLYVGLTRARDRLVLVQDEAGPAPWLDLLGADWFRDTNGAICLPVGAAVQCLTRRLTWQEPEPPVNQTGEIRWFAPPEPPHPQTSAWVTPSGQLPDPAVRVANVAEFGGRLPLLGNPEESVVGDALHGILAADWLNPGATNRTEMVARMLAGHDLTRHLQVAEVLRQLDRFRAGVDSRFQVRSVAVEVPFTWVRPDGQRVSGIIDLLLETDAGWVVVDHKSYPGPRSEWPAKALSYSGQVSLYRDALVAVGRPVAGIWIHFVTGGGWVELACGGM